MRRLFLITMIALLPLRGWVGDAMAMEMAIDMPVQMAMAVQKTSPLNTIISVADQAHPTRATGHFGSENAAATHAECPGHSAMASGDATDNAASGHCNTCGACQICHTVALAGTVLFNPPQAISVLPLPLGSTRFASALPALSLKPPIS